MFYLMTYLTHFIYRYMALDTEHTKEETCCCCCCYAFRLAARNLLYAPSHRWIAHTTTFVIPALVEQEIVQWVPEEGSF